MGAGTLLEPGMKGPHLEGGEVGAEEQGEHQELGLLGQELSG